MSTKGFIIGGSGTTPPKGYITVTYPSGSVCTVTHSEKGKTLTAKDTSGSFVFSLPYIGTWVATATDPTGANIPASKTVEITSERPNVSVELSYVLWLYKAGDQRTALTGGWSMSNTTGSNLSPPNCVFKESIIEITSSGGRSGHLTTKNKINLSDVQTIYCKINIKNATQVWMYAGSSRTDYETGAAKLSLPSGSGTRALPVSNLSGDYYVGFYFRTAGTETVEISEVYGK